MLSAVILSERSYPAMQLASQPEHQRFVHSGPLVLGAAPLNSQTPTADRDRTVSRRSKPSSRTTLIGEQPNPGAVASPKGMAVRHLKWYASWVQNVVRQFGPYLPWALEN